MTQLAVIDDQMRATLLNNIVSLLFGIVGELHECVALWDGHNDGCVYPAPLKRMLELVKIKGRIFASSRIMSDWKLHGRQTTSTRSLLDVKCSALNIAPVSQCCQPTMPATTRVRMTAHGMNRVQSDASISLPDFCGASCRRSPTRRLLKVTYPY